MGNNMQTKPKKEDWKCPCGKEAKQFECCSKECDEKYSFKEKKEDWIDELRTRFSLDDLEYPKLETFISSLLSRHDKEVKEQLELWNKNSCIDEPEALRRFNDIINNILK